VGTATASPYPADGGADRRTHHERLFCVHEAEALSTPRRADVNSSAFGQKE
jgi:hypothetical protein